MKSLQYLLFFLFLFSTSSYSYAQSGTKEVLALKLNEIFEEISDRKTPPKEVGRLIDYASGLFAPKAKVEVDYMGTNLEDKFYSPRKYLIRVSKMPDHGIIIKAKDIEGIDRKGRITGLKIIEII
ncbi:hypothetical protein [Flammeovirga sp. SJP92]|uniref:hypothetical protein n=1 Tax=Flammeovirga sp. SJP92 TaxID=1775430 RepID=UPI0007887910|nr:hypothetical protein [Flammeovirga sp. SJP92]KXX67203.1 hypothetical protein AVL50_27845 [Flammeovirga sp. SJP92]